MFEGFESAVFPVGEASIFARYGGTGPPVLLLHGHPRTSATWHGVAPLLRDQGFTVVCPDLRGYGRSRGPAFTVDYAGYAKRAVAGDLLAVMRELGHERFAVAGHDRGGLVAMRLALDHPAAVARVGLLDSVPVSEHLARIGVPFATAYWHWFFFAQPDIPERVINADPLGWYGSDPQTMGRENYQEWRDAVTDPEVVQGMLADYRAGLTVDRQHEDQDRAARVRIRCPALVLWSAHDDLAALYDDPLALWRPWAADLRGHSIDSHHHMAEERPVELARSLVGFLRD